MNYLFEDSLTFQHMLTHYGEAEDYTLYINSDEEPCIG